VASHGRPGWHTVYAVTDGEYRTVWNYQGGAVPDVRVCEARRAALRERFDELHVALNPQAALATRGADDQAARRISAAMLTAVVRPQSRR
jgi:hypothetical protein